MEEKNNNVINEENPFEKTMMEEQGFPVQLDDDGNSKRIKKKRKILPIILIIIAVVMIACGVVYKFYFGNSKIIMANAIDKFSQNFEDTIDKYFEERDYGDNYTSTSDVKFNIDSEYLTALAINSQDYIPYVNMMKNLNDLETRVIYEENKTAQNALINLASVLNDEEIINLKYLIQDNKQYFFIKGLFDTYVDGGENKYFETLEQNEDMLENIDYVYNKALVSFKKNLKDEYFKSSTEKVTINEKEESVQKITMRIDDEVARELVTNILNDLKADKKANSILTNLDSDFETASVDNSTEIFKNGSGINLTVYVDRLTYKEKMYELEFFDTEVIKLTYVEGKEENPGVIKIYTDDKLVSTIEAKEKDNELNISLLDGENNSLGSLTLVKDADKVIVGCMMSIDGVNIEINATSTYQEVVEDKEYKTTMALDIDADTQGMKILDLRLDVDSSIKNGTSINEDVTNVLQQEQLNTDKAEEYLQTILIKLMTR